MSLSSILGCDSQPRAKLDLRSTRFTTALTCGIEVSLSDSGKLRAWLQALLQELLISTGSANLPFNQPSHKRLACHVTLLKQLLQAGVFGPLQVKAKTYEDTLRRTCMYNAAC